MNTILIVLSILLVIVLIFGIFGLLNRKNHEKIILRSDRETKTRRTANGILIIFGSLMLLAAIIAALFWLT